MTPTDMTALFIALLILAAIPGLSVLAVTVRAVTHGFRHASATTLGIVVADVIFLVLAIFGLALLAEQLGDRFFLIKYLGVACLFWLGFILWRSRNRFAAGEPTGKDSLVSSFLAGLLLTLGDQKAILFYLGFLPAFVDPGSISLTEVFQIMAITVVAVGGVKLAYAFVAAKAGVWLGSHATRFMNMLAAGVLIAIGLFLLVTA
ncbi:LysE family translocator [Thiohalophilus sp.]|uniref:LysE family translocator n=1 Tax=Thiohalophilus sp. TaxID=3028392 RepID=UPI003975D9EC